MGTLIREAIENVTMDQHPKPLRALALAPLARRTSPEEPVRSDLSCAPDLPHFFHTGPLYASLDRSDADHARSRALIEQSTEALVIRASPVEVDYLVN